MELIIKKENGAVTITDETGRNLFNAPKVSTVRLEGDFPHEAGSKPKTDLSFKERAKTKSPGKPNKKD